MLMDTKTARMEFYDTEISSLDGSFKINVTSTKVDKSELLLINNPGYDKLIQTNQHLQHVEINDSDSKAELPIHVILGNGEYARIKTSTKPLIGDEG